MTITILISNAGTGTNLQAIIDGVSAKKIKAKIIDVISDKTDAPGLEWAKKSALPVELCEKKEQLLPLLQKLNPDYICLAGWKQVILDEVILAFPNKILNLHPGLIPDVMNGMIKNPDGTPALWNKGLLATKAVQNFLNHKSTFAGSSIHFLTLEFTSARCWADVLKKSRRMIMWKLYTKKLKEKENALYVEVLERLTA